MGKKQRLPFGPLTKGYDTSTIDFVNYFDLNQNTYNASQYKADGIGPRYGMSPLPRGNTSLVLGWWPERSQTNNRIIGIVKINLLDQDDVNQTLSTFLVLHSDENQKISFAMLQKATSRYGGPFRATRQRDFFDTIGLSSEREAQVNHRVRVDSINKLDFITDELLQTKNPFDFCRFAVFKSPKRAFNQEIMVGEYFTSSGDANGPGDADMEEYGLSPEYNLQSFTSAPRKVIAELVSNSNGLERRYTYRNEEITSDNYRQNFAGSAGNICFSDTGWTADVTTGREDGDASVYNLAGFITVRDGEHKINTNYTMALAASGGKAIACIYQEYLTDVLRRANQYLDLTNINPSPRTMDTKRVGNIESYTEDGVEKATCWNVFSSYSTGSPIPTLAAVNPEEPFAQVTNTAANTGILNTNVVYELAFSIFDKTTGHETNVGAPARFEVPNDNSAITIRRIVESIGTGDSGERPMLSYWNVGTKTFSLFNLDFPTSSPKLLNSMEYRIYFRTLGTFEWLPAKFIDAADYWATTSPSEILACTGTETGSVGGQPGGINDYSELPEDDYIDVVVYRSRAFWVSSSSIRYSNINDPLSYPLRNAISIANANFRGALVHNYPGQAEQRARLIVIGSEQIYVGQFTGVKQQSQITIGASTVVFDLDGSDFVLDPWTSNTAFSARSAIVAEGIFYYWGPKGIFRDNGVSTPQKISMEIEPELNTLYDGDRIEEIFAVYNDSTKEIIWFYRPLDDSTYKTMAIVFNTRYQSFTLHRFEADIKWAQSIEIDEPFVWAQFRVFVGVYDSTSNNIVPYFFDELNQGPDLKDQNYADISVIADGATSNEKLIDINHDESSLSVGQYILIDQGTSYANAGVTIERCIGRITAFTLNNANFARATVLFPEGTNINNFNVSSDSSYSRIPTYIMGIHTLDWRIETNFFCPGGVAQEWMYDYLHFLMRIDEIKSALPRTVTIEHATPVSLGDTDTFTLEIVDNSTGHCQRYCSLPDGENAARGQGLKVILRGTDIFSGWVLQYLAAYGNQTDDEFLQEFDD